MLTVESQDELLRLARGFVQRDDWPKAWVALNKALNEDPDRPETLYLIGHVLRQQGHPGAALPLFAKALAKHQKQPNLWMNYGACLHDLNKHEDAVKAFEVVKAMLPNDPMPPANIAGSLVNMGKWKEAINSADAALKLDPNNYIAQIARTFGCLGLGRWKDAWVHAEYLYGHHIDIRVYNDPEHEEPLWDGSPGKTVVVQCDQGIGDIIMFSQCLPMMVRDCKKVIIETVERMVPMMKRNFPDIDVYGTIKKDGPEWMSWTKKYEIDAHTHISFLGRFYLNKDSDFPRQPYIKPCEKMNESWMPFLEPYPRPWIGIAWKGGIQQTMKHTRSFPLSSYAPILNGINGTFFDLSYHDSSAEVAHWNIDNKSQVINPRINDQNIDATLSLVSLMDEVVTVTTTVAHMCGSMGRSAHVLVPEVPQWRYAYRHGDGTELIWYPKDSVKMYRVKPGETSWSPAIYRVARALSSKYADKQKQAA